MTDNVEVSFSNHKKNLLNLFNEQVFVELASFSLQYMLAQKVTEAKNFIDTLTQYDFFIQKFSAYSHKIFNVYLVPFRANRLLHCYSVRLVVVPFYI